MPDEAFGFYGFKLVFSVNVLRRMSCSIPEIDSIPNMDVFKDATISGSDTLLNDNY